MMDSTELHFKTNDELIAMTAESLRRFRLKRNITQEDLANRAGISVGALKKFESGKDIRLSTLIALLRALDQLEILAMLLPDPDEPSPLELVEAKRERVRARHSNKNLTAGTKES